MSQPENKTCLITGATSGIGKETALELAKTGANVVLTYRNPEKGEKTKQEIIEATGNKNIDIEYCNLESFESIRDFTDRFKKNHKSLHILINNAGVWSFKRKETTDGTEMNFAINHLAPFLLTNLLLDLLKSSSPARIITVSSMAYKQAKINFEDIEFKKSWSSFQSYAQSKLCNILFTKKLAKILEGTGVTANCLHPGVVRTKLFKDMGTVINWLSGPFMISPKKGAQTTIYLAVSEEVKNISGEYFHKNKIVPNSKLANDMNTADKLWEISRRYTGI